MKKIFKTITVLFFILIIGITTVLAAKTFHAQETELIQLTLQAKDQDNDTISYSFSTPLNKSGAWQTGYNDSGIYKIEVAASDGKNKTTQIITLIVENKNREPVLFPSSFTVHEGEKITLSPHAEDLDNDPINYIFEEPFNTQGAWQTTFTDAGTYSFIVTASDGDAAVKNRMNITVLDVDQPPQMILPANLEVRENEVLEFIIPAQDPDGDGLNITFLNAPSGSQFDVKTKTFSWKPDFTTIQRRGGKLSSILNALHLEQFLLRKKTFPLTITACAHDLCNTNSTVITVYNANRLPQFENASSFTIPENQQFKLSLQATDADNDKIHYYFSRPLNPFTGTWTPSTTDQGEHTIFVTATDGQDKQTIPVTVTVLPENKPAQIIVEDETMSIKEGEILRFAIEGIDVDGDNITLKANQLPKGASYTNGVVEWLVPYDTVSAVKKEVKNLQFTASDGKTTTEKSIAIKVKNINQAPQILDFLPERSVIAYVNEPVIFHVTVKDGDTDPLMYEWEFSLHEPEVIGTDTIERTFTSTGRKKVSVTISDGDKSVEKSWTINVQEERRTVPMISLDSIKVYEVEQ